MENSGATVISWRATCFQVSLVKTVLERKVKYDFLLAWQGSWQAGKTNETFFTQLEPVFY